MSDFVISSRDFEEGGEIPKKFGYKHGNESPYIEFGDIPNETKSLALIMDDPDAMGAVGKVWVHWLLVKEKMQIADFDFAREKGTPTIFGKTDFGEIGYGGPAPPDKRHTYVFKAYALDTDLDLKEGFSKQELEDAMKGHIIAEAKLTGTFAP